MNSRLLFVIPVLIWGSTWFAIKFQIGEPLDPLVSVVYRFFLAGLLLAAYCAIKGISMKFSAVQHLRMVVQGLSLFGFNYWLLYLSEEALPSGLVGLIFSALVLLNLINARIFLKAPVTRKLAAGVLLGMTGITLIFRSELLAFSFGNSTSIALFFAFGGAYIASLGNIMSAKNQLLGIPVIQGNAFGMLYGSFGMLIIALLGGKTFYFPGSTAYIASFLYLVVFGSVIAFGAYLTLIGRIGAARAGYVSLVSPVIALGLTTVFEAYTWSFLAVCGVLLILSGNLLALKGKMG